MNVCNQAPKGTNKILFVKERFCLYLALNIFRSINRLEMQEIVHKKGKIYYTMGEVAEMFGVNPSLLRYWEQEFDVIKPHRNKKGNRLFTPQDVDNIRIIYHLLKEKKMKIEVAKKHLRENRSELDRNAEIVERLLVIRSMLAEIKHDMFYDGKIVDDEYADEDTDEVSVVRGNVLAPVEDEVGACALGLRVGSEVDGDRTADYPKEGVGHNADYTGEVVENTACSSESGSGVVDYFDVNSGVAVMETDNPEREAISSTATVCVPECAAEIVEEDMQKPPFEEQTLFPEANEQPVATADEAIGVFGSETTDLFNSNVSDLAIPTEREKARVTIIEQTLF